MTVPSYNDQVFINCPFDQQYSNLFKASIFTILDAGFLPRCSLEVENGSDNRLASIMNLIHECKYGIHDLSRVELDLVSNFPRFNMPFELGLFYGAKHFGDKNHKRKKFLILENEKYSTKQFISDISGLDVNSHANSEVTLIKELRNWLVTASRRTTIPQPAKITERFVNFMSSMRQACIDENVELDSMPFIELLQNMTEWLEINKLIPSPLIRQIT